MRKHRMVPKASLVILLVFLAALVACRPGSKVTQVDNTLEPSPTLTITATKAPTNTPTITPSPSTPQATKTPTASLTHTQTPAPPTEDPDLVGTQTVENLMAQGNPEMLETSRSADGQWQTALVRYECRQVDEEGEKAFEILKLIDLASGAETTVDTQLQNCGGLGAFGLSHQFWSGNGQYLYYTTAREGVPDGLCGYWEPSLIRFGILDQGKTEISLGPLSPDRSRMVFSGGSWGTELTLWDFNQGKLGQLPVKVRDGLIQGIAWAPDGLAFVYLQVEEVCGPPGQTTIVRVDVEHLNQEALFTSDSPGFRGISWDHPDAINLVDENEQSWTLKLSTLEIIPN